MSDAPSRPDPDRPEPDRPELDRDVVDEGSPLAPGRGAGRPATDDPYTEDPDPSDDVERP